VLKGEKLAVRGRGISTYLSTFVLKLNGAEIFFLDFGTHLARWPKNGNFDREN